MPAPLQNVRAWRPVLEATDELLSPRVVEGALRSVGLSRRTFEGPPVFIPYALQAEFAENIARRTGERHFAPFVTSQYGYEGLDLYAKYVLDAPRLDMALVRGIRALRFLQSGSSAELRDDGDYLILQFRSGIGSVIGARHIDEGTVVLLIDLVRHYAGPGWLPEWIELPGAAPSDATLDASLGAPIRWGASLPGIAIRGDVLRALNLSPRDARTATVYRDLRAMVRNRPPRSLAESVRDTLSILASTGDVSEEAVAKWLGLGRRTLQRHLASEGYRFRDILIAFQMDRAAMLLEEMDHSVQEIAYALGYREVNSFRRAFRKWTGKTPTEYAAVGPVGVLA